MRIGRSASVLQGKSAYQIATSSQTRTYENSPPFVERHSSNEGGFRIYRITGNQITKIAEVGPNITSYSDQAAPPKACYVVVAFNSGGESPPTPKVCLVD